MRFDQAGSEGGRHRGRMPSRGLLNPRPGACHDAGMGLTESELGALIVEAFGPLPVPRWWTGAEINGGISVWTVIEPDGLRPARLLRIAVLRERVEEVTEGQCRIHVFRKQPTLSHMEGVERRLTRRW